MFLAHTVCVMCIKTDLVQFLSFFFEHIKRRFQKCNIFTCPRIVSCSTATSFVAIHRNNKLYEIANLKGTDQTVHVECNILLDDYVMNQLTHE